MDVSEIEEFYESETEKAKQEYLQGMKEKKDKRVLEKQYRERLAGARKKYYEETQKYLKKAVEKGSKTRMKMPEKEKIVRFHVEPADMELPRWERWKFRAELLWFKFRLRMKRAWKNIYTPSVSRFVLKTRIKTRRMFGAIGRFFLKMIMAVYHFLKQVTVDVGKGFKNIGLILLSLLKKPFSIFRKKEKKKSGEKEQENEKATSEEEDSSESPSEDASSGQNK